MKKIQLLAAITTIIMFTACGGGSKSDELLMEKGKFTGNDTSLKQYQYPEWFRDAKFGIWAHWGPQAVPRQGDWYAKNMYIQDFYNKWTKEETGKPHPDYTDHLERYGHPSKYGYKDIIPLWKAQRFNPDSLMKLYKAAGARYFVSMGTHHDNFFLWDSNIHRWNSVKMGPHRDIVGAWQKAAKKEGLKFGVSEHLAASFTWFQTAHSSDKTGPYAGVPYDANDPEYFDLYHEKAASDDTLWLTNNPKWQHEWYYSIKELVDMYHPDLLYSDSELPFGKIGRTLVAHYYNSNIDSEGNPEVVYTCKLRPSEGRYVRDVERGVIDTISAYPWQTDTSIGDWFYRTGQKYKSAHQIIQMLADIISKNGNLLINVVQTPEGDLEPDVLQILANLKIWFQINGDAVYATRPWSIYGEGPSTIKKQAKNRFGGLKDVRSYTAEDIRYTVKNDTLNAFVMEIPNKDILLSQVKGKIKSVRLLGSNEKIIYDEGKDGLKIKLPAKFPCNDVPVFQIVK